MVFALIQAEGDRRLGNRVVHGDDGSEQLSGVSAREWMLEADRSPRSLAECTMQLTYREVHAELFPDLLNGAQPAQREPVQRYLPGSIISPPPAPLPCRPAAPCSFAFAAASALAAQAFGSDLLPAPLPAPLYCGRGRPGGPRRNGPRGDK